MASDQTLVMPVQGKDLEYRHIAQIVGRDLGVEAWGSAVEHVSFSSASQYAHTLRNRSSGGHLNVLHSSSGASLLAVTDSGVTLDTLNASTVNATTVNATTGNIGTVNAGTVNATTANVTTVNATTVNAGGATLSTLLVNTSIVLAATGAATFNGVAVWNGNAALQGPITQIGDATTDALIILAGTTFTDATGVRITQYVDTANFRTVYGTQTPPSGLANDLLDVIGGRAYFVGTNEQISLGLRYGPAQTGTYYLGVTNQSTPSLLLKDTSGDEVAAFGDSGDTYQMVLTGVARVTSKLVVGSGFTGTESFRIASGTSLFGNTVTVESGGLVVSGGGVSVTGASVFSSGLSVSASGFSVLGGGASIAGGFTVDGAGGVTVTHVNALTAVSAGAGTASALPSAPAVYLYERVNGTLYRRPLYN